HRRLEQLTRAQKLLGEIDPARDYPYQFVCYRITDFRPDSYPDLLIPGAMLQHDLSLLIEALGSGLPLAEKGEPLVALGELARQWNVSTRTIRRWRKLGLAGRRVIKEGKRQVCFQQSVVERFLDQNQDRVRRGSQFTQISDHEREQILETARELAQEQGSTLTKVSRSLAVQVGRSVEAIRYTIRNHDKTHPEQALFPTFSGPLDLKMKESIYSSYRRGIAVNTLAKTFQKTRTSVYRAINEVRAQNLLAQAIEYIMHPDFEKPEMEAQILAPMPGLADYEAKRLAMKAPRDVLPELAVCYEHPLLDAKQEQHLFRQMNYLKFKAAKLRDRLQPDDSVGHIDPTRIRSQLLDQIESLLDQAQQVKGMLINANMRLVVNIV
ncbi:MAG: helix-turn-helix transcriptional regulator, partial [Gemmataceae bacterium]